MEVDPVSPVAVLKRKSTESQSSFNWCLFCQKKKKENVRKSTMEGFNKVKETVVQRRKYRDISNIELLDRLEVISEDEMDKIKWHKSCYSTFTSSVQIERLKIKYSQSTKEEEIQGLAVTSRRSSTLVNWEKCMFCQTSDKTAIHNVETLEKSQSILSLAKFDNDMRVRLADVNDLIAAEGKYHLKCLMKFERRSRKYLKFETDTKDTAFDELCKVLESGLSRGHVYNMSDVWNKFTDIISLKPNVEIPPKYLSRRQTFNEDIKKALGNKANFVRPTDFKSPLLMYPGDKSDFVISKTLTKSSQKEMFMETSEESSEEDDITCQTPEANLLQEMVHVAIKIRSDLKETPGHSEYWNGIDQQHVVDIIPDSLYLFLKLLFGGMTVLEEGNEGDRKDNEINKKVESIAQDIIYGVSNNTKLTPKQVGLGLALHQATRSENLVNLFHAANHIIGIDAIRRFDNTIANNILDKYVANGNVYVPENIVPGPFVQYSCDNIDVLEATLDGKNTFHCTQMMAWQRNTGINITEDPIPSSDRNKKFDQTILQSFHEVDRAKLPSDGRPKPIFTDGTAIDIDHWFEMQPHMSDAAKTDLSWMITRQIQAQDQIIPIWGAFNEAKSVINQPVTNAGMLPILQAPADNNDSMSTVINRFVSISKHLGQKYTVITADQPLYSRGKELVWANQEEYSDVIFRMGGLHVCFNFLKAIGQHLECSGLDDVWIETLLFAPNTVETVLDGKAYYRAVRGHILTNEALWRIRWRMFKEWLVDRTDKNLDEIDKAAQFVYEAFDKKDRKREQIHQAVEDLHVSIDQLKVLDLLNEFDQYKSDSKNYVFWTTYMRMVEILLDFIRAEREGNWKLHLEAFAAMLPWLTMYDHTNYARWGPVYLAEMQSLENTAPEVYQEFQAGNFVIKRSKNYFNQVSPDQATEWINKMCKSTGGIIGITRNDQTRDRFCATWAIRSRISQNTKLLYGLIDDEEEITFTRNDAQPSRILLDEAKVNDLMQMFASLDVFGRVSDPREIPPDHGDGEHSESKLVSLLTKDVAFDEIAKDLLTVEERGKLAVCDFVTTRLKEKNKPFFESIKKLRSKTFADMYNTSYSSSKTESKLVRADRKLLQRLLNASNAGRSIQIEDILKHELSPVPLSLSKLNGEMNSSAKSELLSLLTKEIGIDTPKNIPNTTSSACAIIDGHAMIQSLGKPKNCRTFGDYAAVFTQSVFNHFRQSTTRVDVVFDRYFGHKSIKSTTRAKRTSRKRPIRKIIQGPDVQLPQVWDQFISSEDNKADIANFLSNQIMERANDLSDEYEVVTSGGFLDHDIARSNKRDVSHLNSNHEEADTRMILHAKETFNTGIRRILVFCRDTDVILLLLYHLGRTDGLEIWMVSGTSKDRKCYPIHSIASCLDNPVIESILGFHALTGCDTTSSFSGISKKSCWKHFKQMPELLMSVGRDGDIIDIEKYLYMIYGWIQGQDSGVNHLRYHLFSKVRKGLELLPPTRDALELHFARANFQAKIWLNADKAELDVGDAISTGGWRWIQGRLSVVWTRIAAIPDACIELTTCGCKTKCSSSRCKCYRTGQICMFQCACDGKDCANPIGLQALTE